MTLGLSALKSWARQHRRVAILLSVVVLAALALGVFRFARPPAAQYFTATVEKGDIVAIVNATGTIDAVTTVEVGSQVSGMISALYADFNSRVKKGQLIAQIDPAPFQARVLQVEADLAHARAGVKSLEADLEAAHANREKNRAALHEAELNWKRTLELFEQGVASEQQKESVEIAQETARANLRGAEAQITQTEARLEQQRAQVRQRQAQLQQTRLDLEHTFIRAPIDGTVIARNVDVGQTVAASLQAPTLFTIAQDLTQMLVYAKTDEADVGRIRVGAVARFQVDSFPDDTFRGEVKQVRMNAYQVQNVVTYDTIIEFGNPELKLLPGMTAYVTIPVAAARDVIKIPNGALRFKPEMSDEERSALLERYGLRSPRAGEGTVEAKEKTEGEEKGEEEEKTEAEARPRRSPDERARLRQQWMARRQQAGAGGGPSRQPTSGPGATGSYQIVWKLNPDSSLQPLRVRTGLTDFAFTVMEEGSLKPNDQLVIGQVIQRRARSPFGRVPRRF